MELYQKRYCSLEDAEILLPKVKKIVAKIVRVNKALELMCSIEISYDDAYSEIRNNLKFNREFFKLSYNLYRALDYLLERGVIVKDVENGIIDFYSFYEGREVLLCWRLGEDSIKYWHEINTGYKDRKPISLLRYKKK